MKIGKIFFPKLGEFLAIFLTIFVLKDYKFKCKENKEPFIIDCGSHIGLSAVFFGEKYHAKILCVEPDPENLDYLEKNTKKFCVTIVPKALAKDIKKQDFYRYRWSWGNSLKDLWFSGSKKTKVISVETVKLSTLINQEVDLLKLDIEGLETEVITESKDKLSLVKEIIVEFHKDDYLNPENSLEDLIKTLKDAGFKEIKITKWFRIGLKVKDISKLPSKTQLVIHAK